MHLNAAFWLATMHVCWGLIMYVSLAKTCTTKAVVAPKCVHTLHVLSLLHRCLVVSEHPPWLVHYALHCYPPSKIVRGHLAHAVGKKVQLRSRVTLLRLQTCKVSTVFFTLYNKCSGCTRVYLSPGELVFHVQFLKRLHHWKPHNFPLWQYPSPNMKPYQSKLAVWPIKKVHVWYIYVDSVDSKEFSVCDW